MEGRRKRKKAGEEEFEGNEGGRSLPW